MAARPIGLRWKLSAAIALVSALVALALSLLVHNAARASMLDSSRDAQDERLEFALRAYDSGGQLVFDARLDDPTLPEPLRRAVVKGKRATYVEERGDGPPLVWAASQVGDQVMSLNGRFADRDRALRRMDQVLRVGSVLVVLSGTALGILIGGQLSRRLRKAAVAARELAGGATEVRVQEAIGRPARDETDELARAVDALADALRKRLEAERRVTADIAHELRTPVTGLVTAAELLPPGRPTELVRNRAQLLRTLIEDVLEVARLDGAAERADEQEVALGEFVRRRVERLDPEAAVEVTREARVRTDPRRLERILGNLLSNARRHGSPPIEVTVQGAVLRIRDHGPGFPQTLLSDGPSRFRTGTTDRARGHGLGLTIAAGQARVLGARLSFRNAQGGGAEAIVWLPAQAETDDGTPGPGSPGPA
ncbi:histidine kinase [Wenjunlia vitaminophila]|uniref:histidine kinase n=1 Tax=Wenjunlia vitaminophila TaxID=76728 RepID=A0A0T6LST0_WENVI|nr:HAMP domain-containing sensor histidine kinase [Wenjunlia vitaminophila]KRV48911.1 histidine kinase [Wenjunlia vitaminophila]